jgi:hypothetical protein
VKLGQGDACFDPPFPQKTVHRPCSAWENKTEAGETDNNDERPVLTNESYSGKRKGNAALVASSASPQGEGWEFVVHQAMTVCDGRELVLVTLVGDVCSSGREWEEAGAGREEEDKEEEQQHCCGWRYDGERRGGHATCVPSRNQDTV